MKFIVGRKKEMTQRFVEGRVVPVTKVVCGPEAVTQIRTMQTDGYCAVQVGYEVKKVLHKPQVGHTKGLPAFSKFAEFRMTEAELKSVERGLPVHAAGFTIGDTVQVMGHTKGRGFMGVVKRHGFHGHNMTHGTKDSMRMPGSIGSQGPQHVFKGMRMGGRDGNERKTILNLEVIEIDAKENCLYIKGAVPGHYNAFVYISGKGNMDIEKMKSAVSPVTVEAPKVETPVVEVPKVEPKEAPVQPVEEKKEDKKA